MARAIYYRKVIRIKAEDSPNVRLALAQLAAGMQPTNEEIVPGVLGHREYKRRRSVWDPIRQCIGLDAQFYKGSELLLYPPDWLNGCESIADELEALVKAGAIRRDSKMPRAIGIDPAEGGDKTTMCCSDLWGILELVSKKTPDTADIVEDAAAFMRKWDVPPDMVVFDRGGGGKQHADTMRRNGYKGIRTVAFGEAMVLEPKRGMRTVDDRLDNREERFAYVNRRAQMFGDLRTMIDPGLAVDGKRVFGIPARYTELRRQLAPIPLKHDAEGRLRLPPKNKRNPASNEVTLVDLIGCSPDEADALVLSLHGLLHKVIRTKAGAA